MEPISPPQNERARTWVIYALGASLLGLWVSFQLWQQAHAWPDMQFAFLAGRTPTQDEFNEFGWKMDGPIGCDLGVCSNDGPASLQHYKVYVFKANFATVLKAARQELKQRGAVETVAGRGRDFQIGPRFSVYVAPGKYDPKTGSSDDKAPWVRVDVAAWVNEVQIGVVRRWLRSLRTP